MPQSLEDLVEQFREEGLSEEEAITHVYEWNESTGAWDKVAR